MQTPAVPPPRLQEVRNLTPFSHFQYDKMGPGMRFYDVVIVCASFVLAPGRLEVAHAHRGPVFADTPWDAAQPERSSLRTATDLVLVKPGTDVFVTGSARARDWTPRSDWLATLELLRGDEALLRKTLRLTGPRHWLWHDDPAERRLSEPEPTLAVPLRYELAFGGWWFDEGDPPDASPRVFAANPSGSGCFGTACRDRHPAARYARGEPVPGPQIEAADAPIKQGNQELATAGFGPVARHWQPRLALAGTYDDAWRSRHAQHPFMDYAQDFDPAFFQYAPADQVVTPALAGGERLRMTGFFAASDTIEMQLPGSALEALCHAGNGTRYSSAMTLDTVHVDLDEMLVHLTWRLTLDQADDVEVVDLFARTAEAAQAAHEGAQT